MGDATGSDGAAASAPKKDAGEKKAGKNRYRSTLNLPSTDFAMKANLVQNEPQSLKRWDKLGLYERLRERGESQPRGRFVFHDGPPYANGSIHLGHLLNKCLKDFVVRTRQMGGWDCPYVPGWDCHGLPIEHKVMTELVESGKIEKLNGLDEDTRRLAIRRECEKYANKFQKLQTQQMRRLLTVADYEHPYLTMQHDYEGAVIETLAGMVEQGLVFRALKPVHWSIANETALAEAELEYMDREDPSVYVDFEAMDASAVYDAFGLGAELTAEDAESAEEGSGAGLEGANAQRYEGGAETKEQGSSSVNSVPSVVSPLGRPGQTPTFMIWTTTPWTLPANMAIAVHPRFVYALVRMDGNVTVVARELVDKVAKIGGAEGVEVLAETTGDRLVGLRYRHAFVESLPAFGEEVRETNTDKVWTLVSAEYVTLEDGTGLVHTATGHGADDFNTGLREGLPVYCPVREDGTYDETVSEWLRGEGVFEANPKIVKHLRESGHLFHHHDYEHSYPHDWRSKTPVIFRATEQWFIGVDREFLAPSEPEDWPPASLRERSLNAIMLDPNAEPSSASQKQEIEEYWQIRAEIHAKSLSNAGVHLTPGSSSAEIREAFKEFNDPQFQASFARIHNVEFVPEWGKNRMRGMLENRPDWCISRQRAWGLPIPAFFTEDGEVLLTAASVRAVARIFREEGSDAWFKNDAGHLLRYYDVDADPDVPPSVSSCLRGDSRGLRSKTRSDHGTLRKSGDILDVWFESGSSWNAVMRERSKSEAHPEGEDFPIELYLEGSDQHRGWFQSSLLPGLAVTGRPPYEAVLTHGFMVGRDGQKLSKSKGHTIESLFENHGADVLRWWVASLPYEGDMKVDEEFFRLAGESYRKVRNTLRFMLGNVGGGVHEGMSESANEGQDSSESVAPSLLRSIAPTSLESWVLGEFDALREKVVSAYLRYDFRAAHAALYDFCNDTLSAVYLAAIKDRLYCDASDSERRASAQQTLRALTDGLCRLLAPVLCHTADEAYRSLLGVDKGDGATCVHLLAFPEASSVERDDAWAKVMEVRDEALLALERIKESGLENPLDAGLILPDPDGRLGRFNAGDLADLCGVSLVTLDAAGDSVRVEDLRERYPRCERSWKRGPDVRERGDGGVLSDRDAQAVVGV